MSTRSVWRGPGSTGGRATNASAAQGANDDWTGFEFGKEDAGNQALCPPQLDHLSFPVQAGIAAQGPWDSNYQIEDHFSWFVPNKKGTHDLKVGARFNYTELRQVSQNNRNGTFRFNTDLPFDPANPRTYPERLTIRVPERTTRPSPAAQSSCTRRTSGRWARVRH